MAPAEAKPDETGSVISKDGTVIGYRQFGRGPGVILVHGGMQASQNFTQLAELLSDAFTVYVPDRRGRGRSGPPSAGYSVQEECDDLEALLNRTDSHYVFGLSSGALISLHAALILPAIHKVALYEPPIILPGRTSPTHWVERYNRELNQGNLAGAMVTVLKGTDDPSLFNALPRFVLVPLFKFAIRSDASRISDDQVPIERLIPTIRYDAQLPKEMDGLGDLKTLRAEVLLLGGNESQPFLKAALDALSAALPQAKRVELSGVGHLAADNSGKPERVAKELRNFFGGVSQRQ